MNQNQKQQQSQQQQNQSKQVLLSVLAVAILVVAVVGVSFAAFTYTREGTNENTISTGTIAMTYTEDTNGISITNAMPMSDAAGKVIAATDGNVFDFTVTSSITGTTTVNYEVAAIKDTNSTLTDNEVKLYLEKEVSSSYTEFLAPTVFTPIGSETSLGSPAGSMILATGSHSSNTSDKYRLRMWVKEDTVITDASKNYTVKVNVYGKAA